MSEQEKDAHNATEALVARAAAGDKEALAELYRLHRNRMVGLAHLRLGRTLHGLLESVDLVQSVWKDVLDDIQDFEYRGPDSFLQWLNKCLMNKLYAKKRYHGAGKRDVKKMEGLITEGRLQDGADPTPSQQVAFNDEMERLLEALEDIPESQRRILILRMRDEMSFSDIGKEIGKSAEAAKKLYQRGMQGLLPKLPEAWWD